MATTYDKASLVMIPSGVKESKLYSIKPTDGSGDFTFSRGTDTATRVNASGLIEKERSNQLLQSNSFDTTWSLNDVSATGGQTGYDGSNDAWRIESTAIGRSTFDQNLALSANTLVTFSAYAKSGNIDILKLIIEASGSNSIVNFDLSDGTALTTSNEIDVVAEDVGGDWWRLSLTASSTTNITGFRFEIRDTNGSSSSAIGSFIYIQDAQVNYGLVAQPYIETTTAAVYEGITDNLPRLDYSGGASCPSLLLEPSRTNIQTNSEYVDAYVKSRSTITTNATTSPEGVVNASKVIPLSTSTAWAGVNAPNYSFTSGQTYTLSVFAKAGEYNYCQVGGSTPAFNGSFATINLTNGVVEHQSGITATTEDYGSGWWRISFTHTAIATASSPIGFFAVYSTAVSSRLVTQVGDDTSGVYMYGWMAEQGSYPTSYIPTYGTAASRAVDSCSVTGVSDLIGQTEGTLFFEIKDTEHFTSYFGVDNVSTSTRILVYGIDDKKVYAQIRNGGTIIFSSSSGVINGGAKAAVAFNGSESVFYVNGIQVGSGSGTTYTNLSQVTLNHSSQAGSSLNQALVFKTRLTNAELAALTA